jgi:H+/Cl- antiporter ClcA
MPAPEPGRSRALVLAGQLPAALGIGIGCSLLLLAVTRIAESLTTLLWRTLPDALGVDGQGGWWILLMLTCTGFAVGLVVRYVPGHAGPDPATEELVAPPMPVLMVPSLLLALVLTLAGGVSLGPENPLTACAVAVACAVGRRVGRGAPQGWQALGSAGVIGALFGTPVGAALVLSEAVGGDARTPLWDRVFTPLASATAGALTTALTAQPVFSLAAPPLPGLTWAILLGGVLVGLATALLTLVAVALFPYLYALFQRIGNPVLMLTAGGLALGLLGVLAGPLSLFKGLEQMREINANPAEHSAGDLVLLAAVKALALAVAAAAGFRGGRIFPTLFIGAVAGECAHALVPGLPLALALSCGVLGAVLVVTRQAWLTLFIAAVTVPDPHVLPVLCVVSLPVWLLVTDRRPMVIRPARGERTVS